jgi:hypothetical protein
MRRGTQVVRERSAKPLCVGSIPTRASSLFLQLHDSITFACIPSFVLVRARWGKIGPISLQGRTKSGQGFLGSIDPLVAMVQRFGGLQNFVVSLHEFSLVFCGRVDVFLDHPK